MPGPSTIVTLEDALGNEYEVRVWGFLEDWYDMDVNYAGGKGSALYHAATVESSRLEREIPQWRPVLPLTVKTIEPLNQDVPA